MSSVLRKTLVAVTALFVLLAMCAAAFAKQNPPRTQLPTDTNISLFIGVSANWESLQIQATRQNQLSAAVSNYSPTETIDVDSLSVHEIAYESAMPQTGWALFKPQNNVFNFNFDVTDALGRLDHITIKDMATGNLLGQINAATDGRSLTGSLTADWNTVYYKIEGFDVGGNSLFRLGVTSGGFDTVVPFTLPSVFVPYRPAFVPSGSHTTQDGMIGTEGNPLSAMGVVSVQNGISQGCGYNSKLNDKNTPSQVQPPSQFAAYIKHDVALDSATGALSGIKSGDPAAYKTVKDTVDALTKKDTSYALTNVDIGPYSDSYGHWHPKFQGAATAVYVIPFTRKRANAGIIGTLLTGIQQFLKPGTSVLTELGLSALNAYLATPQGAPYGYVQGEVQALGNVYTVDASEAFKDSYQLPIMTNVTITMTPDLKPSTYNANGGLLLGTVAAGVTGTPPQPVFPSFFDFLPGTATTSATVILQVSKGWNWKANGKISSPTGFATDMAEYLFPTPTGSNVPMTAHLTNCLILKIVASEPCSIIIKRANMADITGNTSSVNGQNVLSKGPLTIGDYRIIATGIMNVYHPPNPSPTHRTADQTRTIGISLEQTETITLN